MKNKKIFENINQELALNQFYETMYLMIWFVDMLLSIVILISLIQFSILSQSYRYQRVRELLPSIDKTALVRIANNRERFFKLEDLSYKINDKLNFQRLIKILIDENVYLDKPINV